MASELGGALTSDVEERRICIRCKADKAIWEFGRIHGEPTRYCKACNVKCTSRRHAAMRRVCSTT